MRQPHLLTLASALLMIAGSAPPLHAQTGAPSRQPVKGCTWERASDKTVGLAAWVQRCDFGHRKIRLFFQGQALMQQFSDGGKPDPVIEVFDLAPSEAVQAGLQRIYLAHTPKDTAAKCVIARYSEGKVPPAVQRYTFVPNAAYAQSLKAKANPNEVPEPPCGAWGTWPDGIQYFQAWPTGTVRKVLFVRAGQDEPLFDEQTLQVIPTASTSGIRKP